jgi:hypothetical protein
LQDRDSDTGSHAGKAVSQKMLYYFFGDGCYRVINKKLIYCSNIIPVSKKYMAIFVTGYMTIT